MQQQKRNLKLGLLGLLLCLCSFTSSQHPCATTFESNIPDIGQGGDWVIDTAQERLMGHAMMQQINGTDFITRDAVVNDYLHSLSIRMQAAAPHTDFKLHYFCIEQDIFNAFAFFGGHIAVFSGLILAAEKESELAAVLAHETAHVTQQHLARIITSNKKMTPLTIAQMIGAIAIGTLGGSPEAGMHLANAALGAHMQHHINYTRTHEREADRIGIQILSKAGFNPHAMSDIFQKMNSKMIYHTKPPEYLLTHPLNEERMADAYNRATQMPKQKIPDSLFYQLIRARVSVSNQENAKKRVKSLTILVNADQLSDKTPIEYALALALAKNRQYSDALELLHKLIERHPEEWVLKMSLAEINREKGDLTSAIEGFQTLAENNPANYAIHLSYADAMLDTKKPEDIKKAKLLLTKLLKDRPYDTNLLQLLVKAHSMLGDKIDLHQTQAEWHYLRGEHKEAIKQLDLAAEKLERLDKKSYRTTKILARKKEMQDEFKQIQKLM